MKNIPGKVNKRTTTASSAGDTVNDSGGDNLTTPTSTIAQHMSNDTLEVAPLFARLAEGLATNTNEQGGECLFDIDEFIDDCCCSVPSDDDDDESPLLPLYHARSEIEREDKKNPYQSFLPTSSSSSSLLSLTSTTTTLSWTFTHHIGALFLILSALFLPDVLLFRRLFTGRFNWLRFAVSLMTAIATYSWVRKRRRRRKRRLLRRDDNDDGYVDYGSKSALTPHRRHYYHPYYHNIIVMGTAVSWLQQKWNRMQSRYRKKQMQTAEALFTQKHKAAPAAATSSSSPSSSSTPPSPPQGISQEKISSLSSPFSSGPIQKMPYTHGGFFAAAPFLLADPVWTDILKRLMPDVYVELSHHVCVENSTKLIHWAENNPVMAAYGTFCEMFQLQPVPLSSSSSLSPSRCSNCTGGSTVTVTTAIEWDVFLDPHLVQGLEQLLSRKDQLWEQMRVLGRSSSLDMNDFITNESSMKQDVAMKDCKAAIRRHTKKLLDSLLVAHGSVTLLALEQIGVAKEHIFSLLRNSRKTHGGGCFAREWIAIYTCALRLAMMSTSSSTRKAAAAAARTYCDCSNSNKNICSPLDLDSFSDDDELLTLTAPCSTMITNARISQSLKILKRLLGNDTPLRVMLDVKSRRVPIRVWALVLDSMKEAGIHVQGIGSFADLDVRGLNRFTSTPVKEYFFFHTAGDMQQACLQKRLKHGDSVFFNAGSLLWDGPTWRDSTSMLFPKIIDRGYSARVNTTDRRCYEIQSYGRVRHRSNNDGKATADQSSTDDADGAQNAVACGSTIQDFKEHYNLSIGLYCQEFAIESSALDLLAAHVNENSSIYDLGLSWGGFNGVMIRGTGESSRYSHADGLWSQRYAGTRWDPTRYPE